MIDEVGGAAVEPGEVHGSVRLRRPAPGLHAHGVDGAVDIQRGDIADILRALIISIEAAGDDEFTSQLDDAGQGAVGALSCAEGAVEITVGGCPHDPVQGSDEAYIVIIGKRAQNEVPAIGQVIDLVNAIVGACRCAEGRIDLFQADDGKLGAQPQLVFLADGGDTGTGRGRYFYIDAGGSDAGDLRLL